MRQTSQSPEDLRFCRIVIAEFPARKAQRPNQRRPSSRIERCLIAILVVLGLIGEIGNQTAVIDGEGIRGSDWGGGVGGILYSIRGGVPSFTHYNRRGDVTAKTDATGTITYQAEYEAYGKRTVETGATLDRQKSNTKDEDIPGYANEGFRFRDLETGVFLTRDPIGTVLMQPADKWFLDGKQVKYIEYARATLPGIMADNNPNPTSTAKDSDEQTKYDAYVKSEKAIPGEKSYWHVAEPGQPNLYAYVSDNPWTKFDPEGLFESYFVLRALVPGQVAFDNAMTSFENGNTGTGVAQLGLGIAEQVWTVATLGAGGTMGQLTKTGTTSIVANEVRLVCNSEQMQIKSAILFGTLNQWG